MTPVLFLNAEGDVAVGWYANGFFDTWDDKFDKYREPLYWAEILVPPTGLW